MRTDTITVFEDRDSRVLELHVHEDNLIYLRDLIGAKYVSIQTDGTLHISHFVGFFQRGETRLQILPKIYLDEIPAINEVQKSLEFVYRLLNWSGFIGYKSLDVQGISSSHSDLLEIFISIFIDRFIKLFARRINRSYQTNIESQQFIKGKIRFSDTIRRYPVLRHVHVLALDEFSINNPLNQIFKAIIYELLKTTRSKESRKLLMLGLHHLEDVELVRLRNDHFDSIKFTRLNSEYLPLFHLARMFFLNHQPGLSDGSKITYSFLVPINQLFETFIGMVLQEFNGGNLQYLFKGNQRFLLKSDSEQSMELKPDFSVKVGERTICILDAKYKFPWHKGAVTLSQHDVYQICTYATAYSADQVFLIYPAFKGAKESGAVIGDYTMDLYQRPIRLFAIQVDVTSESLENIKMTMRASIKSVIDAMEYPKQKLEI